jgi:predicted RNase H-like HicB family nuclease
MAVVTLSAVIHREDDLYVAECPELGTESQGRTIEEAVANLKEATGLYLEESRGAAHRRAGDPDDLLHRYGECRSCLKSLAPVSSLLWSVWALPASARAEAVW